MIITNCRNFARHKILSLLWKKYKYSDPNDHNFTSSSLLMDDIYSSIWYFRKSFIYDQVVNLTITQDVKKIIEKSGSPPYYIIDGVGIKSLTDKKYLKDGQRAIFKKENLKFYYGIITGLFSNEILRVAFLDQKGFVHDMLTTLKILE